MSFRRLARMSCLGLVLSIAWLVPHLVVTRAQRVAQAARVATAHSVKTFGAKGDGKTLDTIAINRTIDAVAKAGGGTVFFPAGDYLSVSIRLKSNIALYLDHGATIVAATPSATAKYDLPEPNQWDAYQDFGHSHWHNSLIWGENLENISIIGPGRIWGKGLVRSGGQSRTKEQNDALAKVPAPPNAGPFGYPNPRDAVEPGWETNRSVSSSAAMFSSAIFPSCMADTSQFWLLALITSRLTTLRSTLIGTGSTLMPARMCASQIAPSTLPLTMLSARRVPTHLVTRA